MLCFDLFRLQTADKLCLAYPSEGDTAVGHVIANENRVEAEAEEEDYVDKERGKHNLFVVSFEGEDYGNASTEAHHHKQEHGKTDLGKRIR